MNTYKYISEVVPVSSSNCECQFNCIGCEYCVNMHYNDYDKSLEVECALEDN